jgi:hypothetical protein
MRVPIEEGEGRFRRGNNGSPGGLGPEHQPPTWVTVQGRSQADTADAGEVSVRRAERGAL